MRQTEILRGLLLAVAIAPGCQRSEPLGVIDTRGGTPPAEASAKDGPGEQSWPASQRVFVVQAPGAPLILGAQQTELWAARPGGPVLWTSRAESVVQRAVGGDIGHGFRIYVVRGRGRGLLDAPLLLDEIDPETGARVELWRFNGGRNDVAHLSISDVNGDGHRDLAFAYFESKYHVRERHWTSKGEWVTSKPIRMGTERAWGDLNRDGTIDAIVGRMYGDALGKDGDLRLYIPDELPIAIDGGIRTLTIAQLSGDAGPTLYFADGWAARYAAEAKAQLKRVRFVDGRPLVETLGSSPEEYTFNHLEPIASGGRTGLLAWGNRDLSLFWPSPDLPWKRTVLSRDPNIIAGVLLRSTGDASPKIVVPGPATRIMPLSL